jgi:hypothetical protein
MRLPPLVYNWLSYVGVIIAAVALAVFLFLLVFHTLTDATRAPYAGLVIFMIVPAVLLAGLALIPLGMLIEWRRRHRHAGQRPPRLPVVDLNNARHRNALLVFVVGSVLLLFLSAFGGYHAYEYTESVEFCGKLCHSVMRPEHTASLHSPHQRVACVDCHVGPGADWFVRSKVSGLRQVWAVMRHTYPRPIPTPIVDLRPSRETCEQCHWPGQFFGSKQTRRIHFLSDDKNTRWELSLLVKIGGGHPAVGNTEGIHWHMSLANQMEYAATDARRQVIPWVRVTDRASGKVTTYATKDSPWPATGQPDVTTRRMDCMDCHNRPTHIYRTPARAIDDALAAGQIDPALPSVKSTTVGLLAGKYETTPQAMTAIEEGVRRAYADKPASGVRPESVQQAVRALQHIYQSNMFPEMKTRWDVYPDNAGHKVFPGCARCHDGEHRSPDGRVISTVCTSCHVILAQGTPPNLKYASGPSGLEFQHPVDIGDMATQMACNSCHTGQAP